VTEDAALEVRDLSIRFPVYGADSRSLKKSVMGVALGGRLGMAGSHTPIVQALTEVSIDLRPGDRLALVGPNGSGKTTLLRAMAGVYAPDEGSVTVKGRIASLLELSLGIDPTATGYENIHLRGLVTGLSRAQIKEKQEQIAAFSGLGPFLSLPLKTYSSGMMARLAFAVSTSIDAEVLLMDEWIAVGDADFREQAHERLLSMVERSHIMVLASHENSLIQDLCNKFVYMEHGRASPVMPIGKLELYTAERRARAALETA
jgi:lipopolysaccharide transport system ATP-binding protein